jgi:hypothetical protein
LTVTGTPRGTQVQLQFNYHLDSTVGGTPGVPPQALFAGGFGGQSYQVFNQLGTVPGLQSGQITVTASVGFHRGPALHSDSQYQQYIFRRCGKCVTLIAIEESLAVQ